MADPNGPISLHDDNQLFVTNAITRGGIIENLNDYLAGHGDERRLLTGDSRLTDAVCREYAKKLGEIYVYDEEHTLAATDEAIDLLSSDILRTIGIEVEDDC